MEWPVVEGYRYGDIPTCGHSANTRDECRLRIPAALDGQPGCGVSPSPELLAAAGQARILLLARRRWRAACGRRVRGVAVRCSDRPRGREEKQRDGTGRVRAQ